MGRRRQGWVEGGRDGQDGQGGQLRRQQSGVASPGDGPSCPPRSQDVDAAALALLDLERRVGSLQDEIAFLRKVHVEVTPLGGSRGSRGSQGSGGPG